MFQHLILTQIQTHNQIQTCFMYFRSMIILWENQEILYITYLSHIYCSSCQDQAEYM